MIRRKKDWKPGTGRVFMTPMRNALVVPVLAALVAAPVVRAAASSPEALLAAVKTAFEARSVPDWIANVETGPLTAQESDILDRTLRGVYSVKPTVESIDLAPLPEDFDNVLVGGGRRYTLTLKAEGVIRLAFRTGPHVQTLLLPYGKAGAGYKLGTLHGESLGWKGPDDRSFFVKVRHTGSPDDISILVKYNASGVDLVKRVSGKTPNITVPAQYVDTVTVERKADSAGTTELAISCQGSDDSNDVKSVYSSPTLEKGGTIAFERKKPDAAK